MSRPRFHRVPLLRKNRLPSKAPSWVPGAVLGLGWLGAMAGMAAVREIPGPAGSEYFGASVTVLPNGNFVVTDPGYDAPGPVMDVGAVYLYRGTTLQVISVLTGDRENDGIGNGGITVLANGHYVVVSPWWDAPTGYDAGAVTWCSGTTGLSGKVTQVNSLVGEEGDTVGNAVENPVAVTPLRNGNYVVVSGYWGGGRGAVTMGKGTGGTVGKVTALNSLTGNPGDGAGRGGVLELPNGNYMVTSSYWSFVRGAVTFASGTVGVVGTISSANSLVGGADFDEVGSAGISILANGNYVVKSPLWNSYRGAVTWGSATLGVKGIVSSSNSLVGSAEDDLVGREGLDDGVKAMANGGYVVISTEWNGERGAVTRGGSSLGVKGIVSAANSIIGSLAGDAVGAGGVTELTNGNYTIASPLWNNQAGAVTWCAVGGGPVGAVSSSNSLIGSKWADFVGNGRVTALLNGNYVVVSPSWGPGEESGYGAVTWCSGTTGGKGAVTTANSLTGGDFFDEIGFGGVAALRDGHYAVSSPGWNYGRGAVTWGNGTTGLSGPVSTANSFVGTQTGDNVGGGDTTGFRDRPSGVCGGIIPLDGGAYLVNSPSWNAGRGSVTRIGEAAARIGTVTAGNSLTGTNPYDYVGLGVTISGQLLVPGVSKVGSGNFVVNSPEWGGGRGAVTWMSGTAGLTGVVSASNSLVGDGVRDHLGNNPVTVLANGNYVVRGDYFNPEKTAYLGAAAWGSATVGAVGVMSAETALVGGPGQSWGFGNGGCVALSDGNYVVVTPEGSVGYDPAAGFVTAGDGNVGSRGGVSPANSTSYPEAAGLKPILLHTYDPIHQRVIVSYSFGTKILLVELRPGMEVTGNGAGIAHGDTSPALSDHTDFGGAAKESAGGVTRDFAVGNSGVLRLNLAGTPRATVTGTHAADFTVTAQPESPVAGSASTNVRVNFTPGGFGLRTARLTIRYVNAAGVTADHNFAIQGTGLTILEHWRQVSFGTVPALTGNLDDFDCDGVVNLAEFAFGTNPGSGSSGPAALHYAGDFSGGGTLVSRGQPAVQSEASGMHAIFLRRTDRAAAGLSYLPEFSTDLIHWEQSLTTPVVLATEGNMEAVMIPFSLTGPAVHFRIRASLGAPAP